jgi:kynurenine 3-monooxygenase
MNACFEDCLEFDRLLRATDDWAAACARFTALRKPNTDAIAAMALENFTEMRDTVRDPKFLLRKALSFELERRHPTRFIPRYSMVMFHHEIPYAVARSRGVTQEAILAALTRDVTALEQIPAAAMDAAVPAQLEPLPAAVPNE